MELVESKHKSVLLDWWSLDVYGSKKRCGVGVAKDLYKNERIEIDAGVYVTKRLKELLDFKVRPDVSLGLSGRWRF